MTLRRHTFVYFLAVAIGWSAQAGAQTGATSRPLTKAAPAVKIFDGKAKTLVIHGYSTSYEWPGILQRKIDRHLGKPNGPIEIKPAVRGGTPIAYWIDIETGEPKPVWVEITRPALKKKANEDIIVLGQQSLQFVWNPDGKIGIRSPEDAERIAQGTDAIDKYARLLRKEGADLVFVAMHIYKVGYEPAIEHERLALAEALKREIPGFKSGPDIWKATKDNFPKAFTEDRLHPNAIGSEIMAQYWFETLLKHDGIEAPAWSREEMQKAIKGDPAKE